MMLFVNGQDIEHLTLGLFEKTADRAFWVQEPMTFSATSEVFLAKILEYLHDGAVEPQVLTGIAVTEGEGSATALRTVYAIANAWGYAGKIPLFVLKKDPLTEDLVPRSFALPQYANSVHITAAKRDALRRK
jgi:hypothetical protein